jgi:calcium-dependent protein kinase
MYVIVVALQSLHNKNFIHRDLKLDNVMFLEKAYDSPIKIIDLGNVVELDSKDAVFQDDYIVGTPGYLAPESLMRKEYSKKSDIWQAGCTLYSLLSGTPPFDPNNDKQITHFGHYPMTGPAWDDVSSCAKSLVSKLLKKNPDHRLSVEEILKHPWLVDDAPDKDFNQDYFVRIKHLALRNKMKTFFLESSLVEGNMKRRKSLREVLPIFKQASDVALLSEKQLQSDHGSSEVRNNVEVFNSKMKVLKHMVVSSISSNLTEGNKEIDYTTFTNMLKECNLQELCSLQIFNIFDIGNTGTIDPREFLLTMVAFRHDKPMCKIDDTREIEVYDDLEATALGDCKSDDSSDYESASDRDDEVRLLFNLFDIKDAGYIELDELRIAVNFLLYMGSDQPQTLPNIHELFSTIDVAKNGRIDFPEFKQFYKHLIASHISLNVTK